MDLQLKNRRALVTGSTGGIGAAIARMLAAEGATVVIHGRNAEAAERVANEVRAAGGRAAVALGDLSTDADADAVATAALAAFGGIDILVNNAGSYEQVGWMETTPEKWAGMFNHDVLSMVRMIRHLSPGMRQSGWGRIVQIASSAAMQPYSHGPDYSAVKAAIVNLTVSLSKDLAGSGVTAVTVSPGPILTKGFEALWRTYAKDNGKDWGEDWDGIERNVVREVLPNPSGRVGRVEEVAALVALIASQYGGYINGANLRVDGGYVTGVA